MALKNKYHKLPYFSTNDAIYCSYPNPKLTRDTEERNRHQGHLKAKAKKIKKKSYIAEHKKGFTEIIIQLKQIQNHSVK